MVWICIQQADKSVCLHFFLNWGTAYILYSARHRLIFLDYGLSASTFKDLDTGKALGHARRHCPIILPHTMSLSPLWRFFFLLNLFPLIEFFNKISLTLETVRTDWCNLCNTLETVSRLHSMGMTCNIASGMGFCQGARFGTTCHACS